MMMMIVMMMTMIARVSWIHSSLSVPVFCQMLLSRVCCAWTVLFIILLNHSSLNTRQLKCVDISGIYNSHFHFPGMHDAETTTTVGLGNNALTIN